MFFCRLRKARVFVALLAMFCIHLIWSQIPKAVMAYEKYEEMFPGVEVYDSFRVVGGLTVVYQPPLCRGVRVTGQVVELDTETYCGPQSGLKSVQELQLMKGSLLRADFVDGKLRLIEKVSSGRVAWRWIDQRLDSGAVAGLMRIADDGVSE